MADTQPTQPAMPIVERFDGNGTQRLTPAAEPGEFTLAALKKDAAAYLETMPKGAEISRLLGGYPVRDLVILAMAGFACEAVMAELRAIGVPHLCPNGDGSTYCGCAPGRCDAVRERRAERQRNDDLTEGSV